MSDALPRCGKVSTRVALEGLIAIQIFNNDESYLGIRQLLFYPQLLGPWHRSPTGPELLGMNRGLPGLG